MFYLLYTLMNTVDSTDILAYYTYMLPYAEIPLYIVTSEQWWEWLTDDVAGSEWVIVLTEQEVADAHDVFALQFLHMKQWSILQSGKNVLADLSIDKQHVRTHIELLLRHVIIDMRESLLLGSSHVDIDKQRLLHDRLAIGIAYLLDSDFKEIWVRIDQLLWTSFTQDAYDSTQQYKNYLALVAYIDTLEIK